LEYYETLIATMMPKCEYIIKTLEVKEETKNPTVTKTTALKTKQPPQKLSQKAA